jgi:UTP-glucose-1-phosphate uridylyltransferase
VANNKSEMLSLIQSPQIHFHYIAQPMTGKYGTTIPVALCADFIGDESIVVMMGDDFIFSPGQPNQIQQLLTTIPGGQSGMLSVEVPWDQVGRYGVLKTNAQGQFEGIVERPTVEDAPSNFINVSKYLMNRQLLSLVIDHASQEVSGEYYIIEPINTYIAQGGTMLVVPAPRPILRWWDTARLARGECGGCSSFIKGKPEPKAMAINYNRVTMEL